MMYRALQKGKQILQESGRGPEVSRPAAPFATQDPRCCTNRAIMFRFAWHSCQATSPMTHTAEDYRYTSTSRKG